MIIYDILFLKFLLARISKTINKEPIITGGKGIIRKVSKLFILILKNTENKTPKTINVTPPILGFLQANIKAIISIYDGIR